MDVIEILLRTPGLGDVSGYSERRKASFDCIKITKWKNRSHAKKKFVCNRVYVAQHFSESSSTGYFPITPDIPAHFFPRVIIEICFIIYLFFDVLKKNK